MFTISYGNRDLRNYNPLISIYFSLLSKAEEIGAQKYSTRIRPIVVFTKLIKQDKYIKTKWLI